MSAVTDRIERDGPITFAEYMRLALYDPDEGFYARRVPGSGAGYRTSPSLSEWFGRLFARWATSVWEDLDRPEEFTVVEALLLTSALCVPPLVLKGLKKKPLTAGCVVVTGIVCVVKVGTEKVNGWTRDVMPRLFA